MNTWMKSLPFLLVPVFLLGWIYNRQDDVMMRFYMEDPAALVKLPLGTAMIAIIGISLWYASGLLAFFAAQLSQGAKRRSLLFIGALCIWLGIDDMLLLHEDGIPDLFGDDKSVRLAAEIGLFSFYGIYLAVWIVKNRRLFGAVHWSFLLTTLVLFASSIGLDLARGFHLFDPWSRMVRDQDYAIFWEDAPKVVGLFTWTLFIWHYGKSGLDAGGLEKSDDGMGTHRPRTSAD